MAACSCTSCKFDKRCPYAYAASTCEIVTIKNAKKIVDLDFIIFYEKLKENNEALRDDYLDAIVMHMREIISNSKKYIPTEWR